MFSGLQKMEQKNSVEDLNKNTEYLSLLKNKSCLETHEDVVIAGSKLKCQIWDLSYVILNNIDNWIMKSYHLKGK